MKKVFTLVTLFILALNANAENENATVAAPAAVVVADDATDDEAVVGDLIEGDDQPDPDYGGNDPDSDNYGSVDNDDPINPDEEGDDQPDPDYGGNDPDSDNYGSVDNDDPINPDEEGDDEPDPDFGGNDPDSDNYGSVDNDDPINPDEEGDDQPDPDYGGNDPDSDNYQAGSGDMGVSDAELVLSVDTKSVADEDRGGEEFCLFPDRNVGLEIYDNNKIVIRNWSGAEGYDLVVDIAPSTGIGGIADEPTIAAGMYDVTNIASFINGEEVDGSFGGNAGDEDFNVDGPADEGDPDESYGGNDPDSDNYGSVDNDDPINPDEEGDDQPDSDFGGNDPDSDNYGSVDNNDPINPDEEGDDEPDESFGGFGGDDDFGFDPDANLGGDEDYVGDNMGVDPDEEFNPEYITTPTGDADIPVVRMYTLGSGAFIFSETEGSLVIYVCAPDAEGNYDEDSLPRFYVVNWEKDASGIQNVKVEMLENDVIYNLQGQKVGPNYKGFAIKNGKKILIK